MLWNTSPHCPKTEPTPYPVPLESKCENLVKMFFLLHAIQFMSTVPPLLILPQKLLWDLDECILEMMCMQHILLWHRTHIQGIRMCETNISSSATVGLKNHVCKRERKRERERWTKSPMVLYCQLLCQRHAHYAHFSQPCVLPYNAYRTGTLLSLSYLVGMNP